MQQQIPNAVGCFVGAPPDLLGVERGHALPEPRPILTEKFLPREFQKESSQWVFGFRHRQLALPVFPVPIFVRGARFQEQYSGNDPADEILASADAQISLFKMSAALEDHHAVVKVHRERRAGELCWSKLSPRPIGI